VIFTCINIRVGWYEIKMYKVLDDFFFFFFIKFRFNIKNKKIAVNDFVGTMLILSHFNGPKKLHHPHSLSPTKEQDKKFHGRFRGFLGTPLMFSQKGCTGDVG